MRRVETANKIMNSDKAAAPGKFPMLSSKKTEVASTSVLPRVAPAKIKIGPNSPSARAQAIVPAATIPFPAKGKTTRVKACP